MCACLRVFQKKALVCRSSGPFITNNCDQMIEWCFVSYYKKRYCSKNLCKDKRIFIIPIHVCFRVKIDHLLYCEVFGKFKIMK